MDRWTIDVWVCRANIERFETLLGQAADQDRRRALERLLAQEKEKLRELVARGGAGH